MLSTALILFGAGVFSHQAYFRHGEHHFYATRYIQGFLVTFVASVVGLINYSNVDIGPAVTTVSLLSSAWLAGVYVSLLVYRCFFHALHKFPGPTNARFASLWFTTQLGNLDGHLRLHDWHQKHGKYLRIGPNMLSITDPAVMQPAFAAGTKVIKADWYDLTHPRTSMQTTRSKSVHDRRRRIWAPAFSDKALREYEIVVSAWNTKLVDRFGKFDGQPVDVSTWFNLYSFDIMGRLAFGKDYGMVDAGVRHWALDLLAEGMKLAGLRIPVWFARIMTSIPALTRGYWKSFEFCQEELAWRVKNDKTSSNDITGWLLKAYADEKHPENDLMLVGTYYWWRQRSIVILQ
jgi:tryprostatin B 6-hydroxylase